VMTLVITPDSLGPVSISATVTGGQLDVTLHGAHEHGRHALAEALPELRRELEAAGVTVQRLEVGADAGTSGGSDPWARAVQQQLADPQGGQQRAPGDARRGAAPITGDPPGEAVAARASDLSASSGVDVRV
jgi:flagellar hook-length control protein FliK